MSIFTGILLLVCTLFSIYKIILRYSKRTSKCEKKIDGVLSCNEEVDWRFHSTPRFDFPNVQSEADLRILNSGRDLCEEQKEIDVRHFCEY